MVKKINVWGGGRGGRREAPSIRDSYTHYKRSPITRDQPLQEITQYKRPPITVRRPPEGRHTRPPTLGALEPPNNDQEMSRPSGYPRISEEALREQKRSFCWPKPQFFHQIPFFAMKIYEKILGIPEFHAESEFGIRMGPGAGVYKNGGGGSGGSPSPICMGGVWRVPPPAL